MNDFTTDRENLRKLTILLDSLDAERQDEAARRKEYQARIEVITTELLKARADIKTGQGVLFVTVEKPEEVSDSVVAAGSTDEKARAAAASLTANPTPPLPSAEDLDAVESDNEQRRRNSGDTA